eukprot:Gb_25648 [translate_table: standard]
MAGEVNAAEEPIPTSAILMAASKHIATRCRPENKAFLDCKRADPNPEKCLDKGRDVTRCVLSLFKWHSQIESQEIISLYHVLDFDLPSGYWALLRLPIHDCSSHDVRIQEHMYNYLEQQCASVQLPIGSL